MSEENNHPLEYDPVTITPDNVYYESAKKINDCALTRHLWVLYDKIDELEKKIERLEKGE